MSKKLWTCPKCKRRFQKKNQTHSCKIYPLPNHFKNKAVKPLYNELLKKLRKNVGPFRVDSVRCCIHFVTTFIFTGVYILKDKIRVSFTLDHKLKSSRIHKSFKMSANRYLYTVNIKTKEEINVELINWLKQAYNLRRK